MKLQNESSDMVTGPDGKPVKVETVSVVNGALAAAQPDGAAGPAPDTDAAVAANQQLKDEAAASSADPPHPRDREGDLAMPDQRGSLSPPSPSTALTSHPPADAPHARGPPTITAADTGKVRGGSSSGALDFAAAAGKAAAAAAPSEGGAAAAAAAAGALVPQKRGADAPPDVEGAPASPPKLRARTRSQSVQSAREDGRRRGRGGEGEGRVSVASAPVAGSGEDGGEGSAEGVAGKGAGGEQAGADPRMDSAVEAAGASAGAGATSEGPREEMRIDDGAGAEGEEGEEQGGDAGRQGKSGNVDEEAMGGTEVASGDSIAEEDSEQRGQRDTEMTEG